MNIESITAIIKFKIDIKSESYLSSKKLLANTKQLSILLVEDHDDLRENTKEILKKFFDTVDGSKNGEDALKKYKEFHKNELKYYDIVLSDIQMPRLNGVDLVENIYAINSDQIIIILSAFDNSKYLLPLINLGIEQFIKKPIDYQDLMKVLLKTTKKIILKNEQKNSFQTPSLIKLAGLCTFDKETNILLVDNDMVTLTKYEIIFLQILTDNIGKIYSNDDITKQYDLLNETLDIINIRKLVSKLRKKISFNCIESVYGIGYRIVPHFN
ncbi:two component transcriptional regulator, winged helix family [Sulfurimonas denitrificans DSM 1251]|uniref:Two component transcriptional regulator, winged helix family n=1 Tax=Sulfurimonas denitrificans (strain ATCC 33889 / DSM 1251) TaxID=326298 RepID=Q30SB6_SULDN|nr:two component transcriptional regulator, winged helix family [Sulfurimonas denitrificans DSM 1251]